jgi:hypothetical protein
MATISAPRGRPRSRIVKIYAVGAVVLVVWAAYLGVTLPDRNLAHHWNAAWVGLDVLIILALDGHQHRRARRPRAVDTARRRRRTSGRGDLDARGATRTRSTSR